MFSRILKRANLKRELISRLSAHRTDLFIFYDELLELPAGVTEISDGVARVSAPYDFDELEKWWYYGNWIAISPFSPTFEPFDTFRSPDEEIHRVMELNQLSLIIDSFHDDIEWKVHERI